MTTTPTFAELFESVRTLLASKHDEQLEAGDWLYQVPCYGPELDALRRVMTCITLEGSKEKDGFICQRCDRPASGPSHSRLPYWQAAMRDPGVFAGALTVAMRNVDIADETIARAFAIAVLGGDSLTAIRMVMVALKGAADGSEPA